MMRINLRDSVYYIDINSIMLDQSRHSLDSILLLIDQIQNKYSKSIIQFFNENYVLNQIHILNATYFMLKAFNSKTNVSSSRNLEILLYLACNRQIKYSLNYFGLNDSIVKYKVLNYIVVRKVNEFEEIRNIINFELKSTLLKTMISEKTKQKYETVKKFFGVTENQINIIIKSYGLEPDINLKLDILYECLNDILREKMVLLSLEKVKPEILK